ncbi:hypothetical protein N7478_001094 [Penicillium angulare]|uniref:uncharacterized protein n=1 Tax=Penicillium angulare TaxID=116970 RepID=UPI00254136D0|nr:uncharacterized protein N7478_001094 [Penicillium angulare]KAJ5291843.1 hypothetical protein N7478_001094 [Penicillium angulare]
MSGSGIEQSSGIRHPQPPPFGRQSSAPTYGQSPSDAHSLTDHTFPPSTTLTNTTYPSRRSGLDSTRAASSTHLPSSGQTEGLTGRDSPDPDDFYRQTGPLSAPLKASFGDVMDARYSMAAAPSNLNERVSAVPANVLDPSRTRRPIPRSISDSPTLGGGPSADASSTRPSFRSRQPSFRDLVNKFNNTSDSVLPLPTTSQTTSRTASPTGSDRGSERSNPLSRRRQPRESLPSSFNTSNPRLQVESLQSEEPPNHLTTSIPPPLFQRVTEPHSRRQLFGELLTLNTQFNNPGLGVPGHARRRGSDGSIASPNPAFLNQANLAQPPLTPTAWYLGKANSLEAVQSNANRSLSHRRSRSDFVSPAGESLADPWNPEMAVSAPLQQGKPGDGSPGSPNSRSRIPVSSHRLSSGSGTEPLSPTANLTFSNRSNSIPLAPKGTSRLPKPASGTISPPRMTEDGPASFAMTARGRRDMAIGRTRHSVSVPDQSKLLQAYVSAPPPKKSPPLRSSRPRKTVSIAGPPTPRSPEIGRRLSSLQKVADRSTDRNSRRSRQLPELGNVDFETRRQRIQQAFNRTVQENERKEEEAAELRRRTRVDMVPEYLEDDQTTPSTTNNNIPLSAEMSTTVTKPTQPAMEEARGPYATPQLHLNTSVPIPEEDVHNTTMDSPTLGLPDGSSNGAQHSNAPESPTPDSAGSDGTHIDLEPQTNFISRKPSAAEAHRTLLNHIMQIRESSSSSECDENDCSSENEEKQSVKMMLGGKSYFRTSSSVNAEEAAHAAMEHSKGVARPPDNRWSMSSWSSSLQNQDSVCDEEDSGDDLILQRPTPSKEEPSQESSSIVSTRPASFADDEHEEGPVQDLGLTGPSTMEKQQFAAANFFATPPSLAKKGKWDPRRATQLYLEQLTQGRAADLGLAATRVSPAFPSATRPSPGLPSVPEPPAQHHYHPEPYTRTKESRDNILRGVKVPEMHVEPPKNNLGEEPVVVPRFQEPNVTAARNSHTASLVGPDDWEDASPSIMDWMQVAAEGDGITPADERADFMPDGHGHSHDHHDHEALLDPSIARKNVHVQPQIPPKQQVPSAPREIAHSAESSESSSLQQIDHSHSEKAESSATSLGIAPEHLLRADQRAEQLKKLSPSPEQRKLKKRRHVIKELVDTEHTFGQDMKVVEDIYKGTSGSCLDLSPDDVKTLFSNSAEIAQFSQTFQDALKHAAKSIYVMPKSQRFSSKRNTNRPASQAVEEQSLPEAGVSDLEKDRGTSIGEAFVTHMMHMEKVYSEYLKNYDSANKKLQALQQNPKVVIWLRECRQWADDLTTAWDLDSLLVKPVQRILKYPLLLNELLEATPVDHPDRVQLVNARTEVTNASVRINEMKRRADVVEQVVGRKRNQSDVRAGLSKAFGRRTEKFRQQVGIVDMFEDRDYDMLAAAFGEGFFHLQVVMRDVEMYTREMTLCMGQLNSFILGIEAMMNVSPSNYPELESKWRQFKAATKDVTVVALPEHITLVRETVIQPMITLLKLHEGPQRVMKKRDKRLLDYGRFKSITDRGDKPDKKTAENGEQFIALNETLKEELPRLFKLTAKLMDACLKNFVQVSTSFWDVMQKKIAPQVDLFPEEWEQVISEWSSDYNFAEAQIFSLGIANGSLLADSVNLVNFNTPTVGGGVNSPRRPSFSSARRTSTANSSTHRRSIADDSPHVSQEYTGVTSLFQSPRIDSFSTAASTNRHRSGSTFSARGQSDSPDTSRSLQHVTQAQPSASGTSDTRGSEEFPSLLPALSIDGPFLADILKATSTSTDNERPPTPSRYSGFFSSAMPMTDGPDEQEYDASQNNLPNPANTKAPQVLFLAASLYEFSIDKTRREAGYVYLTYVAGEIFDVIGEKGELWLARNQDDSSSQVGWIWNKHFAKLSS